MITHNLPHGYEHDIFLISFQSFVCIASSSPVMSDEFIFIFQAGTAAEINQHNSCGRNKATFLRGHCWNALIIEKSSFFYCQQNLSYLWCTKNSMNCLPNIFLVNMLSAMLPRLLILTYS